MAMGFRIPIATCFMLVGLELNSPLTSKGSTSTSRVQEIPDVPALAPDTVPAWIAMIRPPPRMAT
jgi:hypothetical protein